MLAAWVATWIVPAGQFATHQITYDAGGVETTRTVLTPGTFTLAQGEDGQPYRIGVPLFASGDGIGLFNYAFDGLTSGSRWGGSVGVAAFILIIGGAFGIIMRNGCAGGRNGGGDRAHQGARDPVHPGDLHAVRRALASAWLLYAVASGLS